VFVLAQISLYILPHTNQAYGACDSQPGGYGYYCCWVPFEVRLTQTK